MPSYDYKCSKCGETVTYVLPYSAALQVFYCSCGKRLQRIYNPMPVVFKGTGFYVNDSKPSETN